MFLFTPVADVDECDRGTDLCDPNYSTCTNTIGGYNCTCLSGFEDINGDGTLCQDVDECRYNDDTCSVQATCSNTPGSFQCTCLDGFEGTGLSCTGEINVTITSKDIIMSICCNGCNLFH